MIDAIFGQLMVSVTAGLLLSKLLLRREKAKYRLFGAVLLTALWLIPFGGFSLAMIGYGIFGKLSLSSLALSLAFGFPSLRIHPARRVIYPLAILASLLYLGVLSGCGVGFYNFGYSPWALFLALPMGVILLRSREKLPFFVLCAGLFCLAAGIYRNFFNAFIDGAVWIFLVIYAVKFAVCQIAAAGKKHKKASIFQ